MYTYKPIVLGIALALGTSVAATSEATPRTTAAGTAIPPIPLKQALHKLAQRDHLRVVYRTPVADDVRTNGARAGLSQPAAIGALLRDTGLRYRYIDAHSIAISQATQTQDNDTQSSKQKTKGKQKTVDLSAVTVTGSRIRRVDVETSNPVITITPQAIQMTGDVTLGDIVQDLPVITGPVSNPNVNNGGGDGGTFVGLRGLGAGRTLVLIDGQRTISSDLNSIPAAAVERIEVLTTGASSVYGSDAIGGVINIILKDKFQGAQLQLNYGESSHHDGKRRGLSFVFGQATDKGSIYAGVGYNKTDAIQESARAFSAHTLSITGSTNTPIRTFAGGSGFSPWGHTFLPKSLQAQFGCRSVAVNHDAVGGTAPLTLSDFHCYDAEKDGYSFSDSRPITTPQERTNAFLRGTYKLAPHVEADLTYLHNKTDSGFLLGPIVWATGFGPDVSKDSMFNPFGVDFTATSGNTLFSRLTTAPNRFTAITTTRDQAMFDLRGDFHIFDMAWTWDVGYNFGHSSQQTVVEGLPNTDFLNAGLGASMLVNGQPACVSTPGDASTVIPDCVPWDTWNLWNPASLTAVNDPNESHPAMEHAFNIQRIKHVNVSGGVFDTWGGTAQLALGMDWRDESTRSTIDPVLLSDENGNCTYGSQCSSPLKGGFSVKEIFGELFVPIVGGLPGIYQLNVDVGFRHSKYSDFGSTNNWKVGVEYRPTQDLMLRGTVAEVFRAPGIGAIFASPSKFGAVLNNDPCDHITSPNAACQFVPTDGSFVSQLVASHQQGEVLASGSAFAGFDLGPEQGKSFDWGIMYSPSFVPGFTANVDFWKIYLNDVITGVSNQTIMNACFAGVSKFCPLIHRFGTDTQNPGQIQFILEPTVNLGRIDVQGTDLDLAYRLPAASFGQFTLRLQGTYMKRDDVETAPGIPGNEVIHGAGIFNLDVGALGFVPRVRGFGSVAWRWRAWDASWRIRYIGGFDLGSHVVDRGFSAVPGFAVPHVLEYGARAYNDIQVGYQLPWLKSRVDFGVNNVFNKQPPILFQTNIGSGNANTSPSNFDPIGTFFWGRVTVRFD